MSTKIKHYVDQGRDIKSAFSNAGLESAKIQSELIKAEKKGTYSYYLVNLGMLQKYLDAVKKLNG